MDTIVEYAEQELSTFAEKPVNAVDSLLFSQLSYLNLGEAFPAAATERGLLMRHLFRAESFDTLYRGQRDEDMNYRLLAAVAASPRYRDVVISSYVNEIDEAIEKQFSVETFELPGGDDAFIMFRGTDSTIIGWKENFNMSICFPVPAQVDAAAYLDKQAARHAGALYVGGHSKGGNLAEYAGFKCKAATQQRIKAVFDHDGPGFAVNVFDSPAFKRIEPRIDKTVPQSSVVGMLFESVEYRVVRSSGVGIMQHDPYTWAVDIVAGDFDLDDHISHTAQRGDQVLATWIDSMDEDQRKSFTDTMYKALTSDGAKRFQGNNAIIDPAALSAASALRGADPAVRDSVLDTLGSLAKFAMTPTPSCKATGKGQEVPETWKNAKLPDGRPFMMTASEYLAQIKDQVLKGMTEGGGAVREAGEVVREVTGKEGADTPAAPHSRAHVIPMPSIGGLREGGIATPVAPKTDPAQPRAKKSDAGKGDDYGDES